MSSLNGQHFDAVIIGAGMSGLAAGIRLAHFDYNVLILERHSAPGGLNSFYRLNGRNYDVGLHAMTNFVPKEKKGTPLGKILKQLRLSRDDFNLSEQNGSRIVFPGHELQFSNDFEELEASIAKIFPKEMDAFSRLLACIQTHDDTSLEAQQHSAKSVIQEYIRDPLLIDMLLLPLMYYGSAEENDMDFNQFVIMFKSIYLEGFARPFEGVKQIIQTLLKRYSSLGGLRKMNCGVKKLITEGTRVSKILLDNNESISADHVLSSAGSVETLNMCEPQMEWPHHTQAPSVGKLSFVECIHTLSIQPAELNWQDTIVFFNNAPELRYACPDEAVDPSSGVICLPNNYQYESSRQLNEGILRITAIANYKKWSDMSPQAYLDNKAKWEKTLLECALTVLPQIPQSKLLECSLDSDMFTPKTIQKFTGHLGGAIYGSPQKIRNGHTPYQNLYICGTDQGFLGIVGAMLSGISMANFHILTKSKK